MTPEEVVIARQSETSRILCPSCSDRRKSTHRNDKTCSVTVNSDHNLYHCHHCGWDGRVNTSQEIPRQKTQSKPVTPIPTKLNENREAIKKFFSGRGITIDGDMDLPPMVYGNRFFRDQGELPAVGFVYGTIDDPMAIKWRALGEKTFTQSGTAKTFYGVEKLGGANPDTLIIVEGEADAVALASIGITAVSIPNGAVNKISQRRVDPEEDTKFGYVWEATELIDSVEKVVLLTDNDKPGDALKVELARRVGIEKCWEVVYPAGCKDITDVIREHGAEFAKDFVEGATPIPLQGVYGAEDYAEQVNELYVKGYAKGESTGLSSLDELITIAPSQMTVITGMPCAGKSEWLDQVILNLAMKRSWKFAIASFENPPPIHLAKLSEKFIQKPFFEGASPRMSRKERDDALEFMHNHFVFLEQKGSDMVSIESIMERTRAAIRRNGIRGLVIDPYNFIKLKGENEHQGINDMLTRLSAFAKSHQIHIFFVAHPAKMHMRDDGTYPVPKGQNISGSASWHSKSDLGVTVHRSATGTEIHVWKCRFKWVGSVGMKVLDYDVLTGTYSDMKNQPVSVGKPTYKKKRESFKNTVDTSSLPF